jgi:hypothetical protein
LFRAGDKVLFEAGLDITLQNGAVTLANGNTGNRGVETSIDLSFATLDYLLNDYVTIVAGDMLLPLGTYSERSAGWLNKIPDDPLPRGVLPPSGGGRIGWFFPLKPHYDVELGISGQSAIDVSKYPQGIRTNYQLFSQECSHCHRLSRPINSQLALPDEWSRCIRRMMNKPGSGIGPGDGKRIYEFLVYDSSVRKQAVLDEKLAKATPAEKAAALAKIKEIRDKYGH